MNDPKNPTVGAATTEKRTLVEEGTRFKGSLTSTCPILVQGAVEGDVDGPAVTVSSTGLVTAVVPFVCSWTNVGGSTPAYQLTGSYKIVASFQGVTSQPVYVGVASQGGDGPSGACGP